MRGDRIFDFDCKVQSVERERYVHHCIINDRHIVSLRRLCFMRLPRGPEGGQYCRGAVKFHKHFHVLAVSHLPWRMYLYPCIAEQPLNKMRSSKGSKNVVRRAMSNLRILHVLTAASR